MQDLKVALRHALAHAGVWVGRPNQLALHYHVAELLATQRADCVFDVGASRGQYGRALRQAGYRGPIVSFEPVSEAFCDLQAQAQLDPSWSVRQVAVADKPGTLRLNIAVSSSVSSFLAVTDDYVALYAPGRVQRTEDVQVTTVDDVAAVLPFERIFLKTDTQGFDLRVLEGARETIASRVIGLQVEMSVTPIYHGMPDYIEALTTVRELGFVLTGMYPVPSEPIYEFDGVFRRDTMSPPKMSSEVRH
jgi:FkbM family methyltransferase